MADPPAYETTVTETKPAAADEATAAASTAEDGEMNLKLELAGGPAGYDLPVDSEHSFVGNMGSLKPCVVALEESQSVPWIRGMQLSLWDNVCGPRIVHVWNGESPLSLGDQSSLAQQTLKDEICRPLEDATLETKLHILPELESVVASVVFTADFEGSPQRFSLSLLVARTALPTFLRLHRVIHHRMGILAEVLRLLVPHERDTALAQLRPHVAAFVTVMRRLQAAGLPPTPFSATFFGMNTPPYDHVFVAQAVAAHVAALSCTVVVGADAADVDRFVATLALFCTDEERAISSLCTAENAYVPGLRLQGLVGLPPGDADLLWSATPTALVQLNLSDPQTGEVMCAALQALSASEHASAHAEFVAGTLRAMASVEQLAMMQALQAQTLGSAPAPRLPDCLFRAAKTTPLVEQWIVDIERLPVPLRPARIHEGMRILRQRAVLLLRHVVGQRRGARTLNKDGVRRVKDELGLTDADFELVGSVAESFMPGVAQEVLGAPALMEQQLQILLESFL